MPRIVAKLKIMRPQSLQVIGVPLSIVCIHTLINSYSCFGKSPFFIFIFFNCLTLCQPWNSHHARHWRLAPLVCWLNASRTRYRAFKSPAYLLSFLYGVVSLTLSVGPFSFAATTARRSTARIIEQIKAYPVIIRLTFRPVTAKSCFQYVNERPAVVMACMCLSLFRLFARFIFFLWKLHLLSLFLVQSKVNRYLCTRSIS